MTFQKFEDIVAWKRAQDLAFEVYRKFGKHRDFGFRDQITRASVSVSNNIAEGFDKGTDRQFAHYLNHSQGSCSEVRSMLHLALRLGYLNQTEQKHLLEICNHTGKLVKGLQKFLKK